MADSTPVPESMPDNVDPDDGGKCKWGPIQPSCCQRFRNPKIVLFWLCWAGALQGFVVSGVVNVILSTIERRFQISSTESGTIVSGYDIASAICLLPVSYFGGYGIKPRYVAAGVFTLGLGSFLFALPHFTTDLYTFDVARDTVCDIANNNTNTCGSEESSNEGISSYKYVFILAQLLHGAGATPFYTLGVTYLDENLPLRSSPLYNGVYFAFVILGTAVGYLAGGEMLNTWTDVGAVDTSRLGITPDNIKWVGAWWIGFLLSGFLAVFISVPLAGFPRALPGWRKHTKRSEEQDYTEEKTTGKYTTHSDQKGSGKTEGQNESESKRHSLKKILHSAKILLTNPTFMFINLVGATEAMVVGGFSAFMPKFLEYQFSIPASRAAQYVGLAAIPAGGGGTFLGGYLVKRFNLKVPGILKFCIASSATVMILAFIFLVHCDNVPFAGINVDYQNQSSTLSVGYIEKQLDSVCNSGCGCVEEDYRPVCGRDGVMYFSPCYAGCQEQQTGEVTRYMNCSCVMTNATDYMAELTTCESPCPWLPLFLPVFAIIMFLTFLLGIPSLTVTLRCVPGDQRSFAMGIQWLVVRCLGAIPGPIIFGKMIDLSCLLWQQRCDGNGSCFFYDNQNMSYYLMSVGMVIKAFSTLFFFLALVMYKPPKDFDIEKDESPSKSHVSEVGVDNPVFSIEENVDSEPHTKTSSGENSFKTNFRL